MVFGLIPGRYLAHELFRTRTELQLELKTHYAVHLTQKVEQAQHFGLDLVLACEDMSIILSSYTISAIPPEEEVGRW